MLYEMYMFEKPEWWEKEFNSGSGYYKRHDITFMRYCPECNTDIVSNWQVPYNDYTYEISKNIVEYLGTGSEKPTQKDYANFYEEFGMDCLNWREQIEDFFTMEKCPVCGKNLVNDPDYHVSFTYVIERDHKKYGKDNNYYGLIDEYEFNNEPKYPLNEQPARLTMPVDEYQRLSSEGNVTYKGFPIIHTHEANGKAFFEYLDTTLESKLEYFKTIRKGKIESTINKDVEQLCSRLDIPAQDEIYLKEKIVSDKNVLTQFLKNLVSVESNIYSLKERIANLYQLKYEGKGAQFEGKIELKKQKQKEIRKAELEYESLLNLCAADNVHIEEYIKEVPSALSMPTEPAEPTLEKPNFFNKKRVAAENDEKLKAYEKAVENYKKSIEEYNKRCSEIENVLNENKANEKKYQDALAKEELRIEKIQSEAKEKIETIKSSLEHQEVEVITPNMVSYSLVIDEIEKAEQSLQKAYEIRNKMYASNVVFDKYRNLAAVATFYEYLASGRSVTLEGTEGAYNIYENELRANLIIGQLSQVIISLEKIQANQYLLYSAISDTNRQLNLLNDTMTNALDEIKEIKVSTNDMRTHLKNIETNTAVTAYNTEVTAYYSKKNAELTNALGFLVALK